MRWRLLVVLLFIGSISARADVLQPAARFQTLWPSTTTDSIWVPVTIPFAANSVCLYAQMPIPYSPRDRKVCGPDFKTAFGKVHAGADTILMNVNGGNGQIKAVPLTDCPDTLGRKLVFTENLGITCPPAKPFNAIFLGKTALPNGTNSTSFVMVGMANNGGFSTVTTPNGNGTPGATACVFASLAAAQLAGIVTPQRVTYALRWGTGPAPANGDPDTGTPVGATRTVTVPPNPGRSAIAGMGYVCGLTPGVQVWFDIAFRTEDVGGYAQVFSAGIYTKELNP